MLLVSSEVNGNLEWPKTPVSHLHLFKNSKNYHFSLSTGKQNIFFLFGLPMFCDLVFNILLFSMTVFSLSDFAAASIYTALEQGPHFYTHLWSNINLHEVIKTTQSSECHALLQ